ncbi:DUF305 domain-containing protein [Homoserinimonas sp. OAct 916]|uniref:DUF305 domain-containing protein n=1 Tax=Homoserinimonas sp. OAct 916 TaxID=2211450 RepID=UPI000DBE2F5A|nr:DUF305 domain-containing protein [Homoserinimonas sp. OAct 916]
MHTRAALTTAITLSALIALSGCATTPTTDQATTPSSAAPIAVGDANTADVMFTTMMIPHHEQAVEMADMVLAKNGIDSQVTALAEQIKAAQGPEIETMRGWLEAWGVDSNSGMGGMNHGDGMMTGTDMDALDRASGDEASRLFLEQMIQHHEGAIQMAESEVDTGQNPDVVALAQRMDDAQTAEITTMRTILTSL